jgi:hypothetical protein
MNQIQGGSPDGDRATSPEGSSEEKLDEMRKLPKVNGLGMTLQNLLQPSPTTRNQPTSNDNIKM